MERNEVTRGRKVKVLKADYTYTAGEIFSDDVDTSDNVGKIKVKIKDQPNPITVSLRRVHKIEEDA